MTDDDDRRRSMADDDGHHNIGVGVGWLVVIVAVVVDNFDVGGGGL